MNNPQEQLENLKEIRSILERSSRFISLSGLIGIVVGIIAIFGVIGAYLYLGIGVTQPGYYNLALTENGDLNRSVFIFLVSIFILVLLVSLFAASFLTIKKAKEQNEPIWDTAAKRLVINLLVPLATGGIFCIILLYHGYVALVAPTTLIFYGLGLVNASKYTISDIRNLGIWQLCIGLVSSFFLDYGLLFWALGFGLIHIVYGVILYLKYDK